MNERTKSIMEDMDSHQLKPDDKFKFHCNMCGKCCIHREDILLTPRDMYKMAQELKLKPKELLEQYCEAYVGGDSGMVIVRLLPRGNVKRCPLLKDRKCMVHKSKPTVCAMFPIGRGLKLDKEKVKNVTTDDTIFFYSAPECKDDTAEHTVREWLEGFGIPVQDDFFISWQRTVVNLATSFRKMEKKVESHAMMVLWQIVLINLYLSYDTEQDFMPQFERNAKKTIEAVDGVLKKCQ